MSLNEVFLELKRGDQTHFNWFYENSKKQLFYNILSYTKNYELSEDLLHYYQLMIILKPNHYSL